MNVITYEFQTLISQRSAVILRGQTSQVFGNDSTDVFFVLSRSCLTLEISQIKRVTKS